MKKLIVLIPLLFASCAHNIVTKWSGNLIEVCPKNPRNLITSLENRTETAKERGCWNPIPVAGEGSCTTFKCGALGGAEAGVRNCEISTVGGISEMRCK